MLLRQLVDNDVPDILKIINDAVVEHGYIFDVSYHQDLLNMEQWYSSPNLAIVATLNNTIIGSGAIQRIQSKDAWELRRMYVSKEYRGLGTSHKIIQKLLEHASDNKDIFLTSDERYTRSHSFYMKYGFQFTGEETITYDPEYSRNFIMKLQRSIRSTDF